MGADNVERFADYAREQAEISRMTTPISRNIDTAALRALADARDASGQSTTRLFNAELRALCDGYDEAQRLDAENRQLEQMIDRNAPEDGS